MQQPPLRRRPRDDATSAPWATILDLPAAEQPIRLIMSDPPASVEQHDSLRDVAKELAVEEIGVLVVESPVGSVGSSLNATSGPLWRSAATSNASR